MSPPVAAAALAALSYLETHPERVSRLQGNGRLFFELAKKAGIDTGTSTGLAIVPAITGSSLRAARLADALFRHGVNVQPIIYPAVPEKAARLRFFISCEHGEDQLRHTVELLAKETARL